MVFAPQLEDLIRQEGLDDLPCRFAALQETLALQDALDRPVVLDRHDVQDELRYLQRATDAMLVRERYPEMPEQISELCGRFETLSANPTAGHMHMHNSQENTSGSTVAPFPAEGSEKSSLQRSGSNVAAVAEFLIPGQAAHRREDEVRLLSFEGRLQNEFSKYTTFAEPATTNSVMLRSWASEDDEYAKQQTQLHYLKVTKDLQTEASALKFVAQDVAELASEDDCRFQEAADTVSKVRADTEEAATNLIHANRTSRKAGKRAWIASGVGLTLMGGAGLLFLPAGACAGTVAGVSFLTSAGLAMAGIGALSEWQKQVLEHMQQLLPFIVSFPAAQAEDLCAIGKDSEERQLKKLWKAKSWQNTVSIRAWTLGVELRQGASELRCGGRSFVASFDTDVSARQAFKVVKQMSFAGNVEPRCKFVWSCPVQLSEDGGTFLRYVTVAQWKVTRGFLCVCRQGKVVDSKASGEGEQYTYVLAPVSDAVLRNSFTKPGCARDGDMQICFSFKDRAESRGAVVQIMFDVDQATSLPNSLADVDVRYRLLTIAGGLRNELQKAKR